ncbi:3D domain-containing protein [Pelosinus sp. sgz500959]|uniref:3D domain-containing protein n=1 Tax=Pelosinus sp. sgz500959 TaxID=3242472 RepID=UPI00366FA855
MGKNELKKLFFRKKLLPLILVLVVVLLLATGFMFANKKVHIAVDDSTMVISTLHSKPEDVLVQAGVKLGPKDEYRLSTAKLVNDTVISVQRAVPVTIAYQGKTEVVLTAKRTVGELAESLGVNKPDLKLIPSEQAKVEPNMHIQVVTLTEKVVESQVPERFTIIHQPDSTLEKGVERIVAEGEDGTKKVTSRLQFADGVEVSAQPISEVITEQPKPRIIHVGTRDTVETSRGAMRFSRVEMMEASAYLPTDGSAAGLTATGISARHGIVAVDPNVIPLGTEVYVQGYGVALAADVGGAIVGNRIDLCIEDYSEAMRFGRRSVKVYVLN